MGRKMVVFGSFVMDLTGFGEQLPVPGETLLGASFKMGPGGKGSNQAIAAHRAGADITLITKLGRDAFGRVAKDFYVSEGMDISHILEDEEKETGAALILVNQKTAQNMIMVMIGACGNVTREDVLRSERVIAEADFLLLQLEINLDALELIVEIASRNGTRIILNPAPFQPLPDELLGKIDTVTPNETEVFGMTGVQVNGLDDAREAARRIRQKGVRNAVITLGEKGCYVTDGEKELLLDRIEVDAIDTTGAGDAFNGGFVKALADGMDIFDAARYGNCVGALSVTRRGTAPAMPSAAEVDALYEKTYG